MKTINNKGNVIDILRQIYNKCDSLPDIGIYDESVKIQQKKNTLLSMNYLEIFLKRMKGGGIDRIKLIDLEMFLYIRT